MSKTPTMTLDFTILNVCKQSGYAGQTNWSISHQQYKTSRLNRVPIIKRFDNNIYFYVWHRLNNAEYLTALH